MNDQLAVQLTLLITMFLFGSAKFNQHYRIMRRSYIDDIERKARKADGRIADLMAQLDMQYSGEITKQVVAHRTTQMMFDLPAQNSRTFKFPYTISDPVTGEVFDLILTGKWTDWQAWQAGKQFIKRRNHEQWIDPSEVTLNDLIPVQRKVWDRRAKDYIRKNMWVYPDEKLVGDLDIGPFSSVEE